MCLIKICTSPNLKTFYIAFIQDMAVLEIKACVSFQPVFSKFVKNTAAESYYPVAFTPL